MTIARALVNQPAIVWADEPTGDLDSKTSQDIINLMKRLNHENGQTFILVTHSATIGQQADRIIWMRDGQIEPNLELAVPESLRVNGQGVRQNAAPTVRMPALQIAIDPV